MNKLCMRVRVCVKTNVGLPERPFLVKHVLAYLFVAVGGGDVRMSSPDQIFEAYLMADANAVWAAS